MAAPTSPHMHTAEALGQFVQKKMLNYAMTGNEHMLALLTVGEMSAK